MDDNFSPRVKDVIAYSKEEALRLGHDFIGTEHLILGLLRDGNGKAIRILESLDIAIPEELKKQAAKEKAIDPHAYELLMKAKYAYINAASASDLDIAAALFKQAFDIQPSYITARNFYAFIQFRLKKTDEAISILEEAEQSIVAEQENEKNTNNVDENVDASDKDSDV